MKNELGSEISRRELLEFFGKGALALSGLAGIGQTLGGCTSLPNALKAGPSFQPLEPSDQDDLLLAKGFRYQVVASFGDVINSKGERFGFNNDFLAFIPFNERGSEGLLWVNHETPHEVFVSQFDGRQAKSKAQVELEMDAVGGSVLHISESTSGKWQVVTNSSFNRRITGKTEIPLVSERPILGAKVAVGTLGNCGGGITPWGTVLTCEENYDEFYGEVQVSAGGKRTRVSQNVYDWHKQFDFPPEHYGWVVEVNPKTGAAKKLTSLGRFAHEGATVVKSKDGRPVVYLADDTADQFLYKFVATNVGSLEQGTLYVANISQGRWIPLVRGEHPILTKVFKDQTDMLVNTRRAAELLGATPLDRPEDIEVDARTGHVYVALTNNVKRGNYHGSILKLIENGQDAASLEFRAETFLVGGPSSGFACPDNMAFDRAGNLWMTSDISGKFISKPPYHDFKNNGLFYIPFSGANVGRVLQVASAPREAELTGPTFSPDGRTLFLSVQHPGEFSKFGAPYTSHWPDGGTAAPRPSVVAISGPALDALTGA